jgi:hypothetical protein
MHPFVFREPVLAQVSPPPTPPPEGDSGNFRNAKIGWTINSRVSNSSGPHPKSFSEGEGL